MQIQEPQQSLTYPVIATDFVTMEEGTGIVHIAPAFGEADFDAGHKQHLDFVQHVDLQGKLSVTILSQESLLKMPIKKLFQS